MHNSNNRINWMDILTGITTILVAMFHVRLLNASTGRNYDFVMAIVDIVDPVIMPTFFFISGGVLFFSRIKRGYDTWTLYKDKFARLVIPFIFCTCIGNMAQMAFNSFVKHPREVTPATFLTSFFTISDMPWPHRWYLMALIVMMMMYPLFVLLQKSKISIIVFLILFLPLRYIPIDKYIDSSWMSVSGVQYYIFFFFSGIVAFKYNIAERLNKKYLAISLWLAFAVFHYFDPENEYMLLQSLVALPAMIVLSLHLAKYAGDSFRIFGKYNLQIYIYGIAFQAFVELILWKMIGCNDAFVYPVYILSLALDVLMPIAICSVISRIPCRWLHVCLGLK